MGEPGLAMGELSARRRLVKSPPELWAELSDIQSLAKHLGEFGEIRISRLEPETTVAWEGAHWGGTVAIESSGWGTQVTLTAVVGKSDDEEPDPPVQPEPTAPPGPTARSDPPARPEPPEPAPIAEVVPWGERRGFFSRLFGLRGTRADGRVPAPVAQPVPTPPAREEEPMRVGEDPMPVEEHPARVDVERARVDAERARAVLEQVLDNLGQAHHRPFSRA